MNLTAANVEVVFTECLFKQGEDISTAVKVEGVIHNFGFHPDRLKQHTESIRLMLQQLPDEFFANRGGGWTFLNACVTRDGVQWGEHVNVEQLIALGMAIDKVKFTLPRDTWNVLPGGMPYFEVKD